MQPTSTESRWYSRASGTFDTDQAHATRYRHWQQQHRPRHFRRSRFEAARLAAVLPSPNKWRVDPAGPYVRQRTGTILARMDVVARDGLDQCVLD